MMPLQFTTIQAYAMKRLRSLRRTRGEGIDFFKAGSDDQVVVRGAESASPDFLVTRSTLTGQNDLRDRLQGLIPVVLGRVPRH